MAPTALLLDALVALGVARSDGERHVLTPLGEFLRGSYQDLGDAYWRAQPDYFLTGRPVLDATALDPGTAFCEGQARALAWMTAPAAAARELGIGSRRRGLRVLDAGAGAAGWSIRLAAHDPALRITALDRPEVIETARQAALRAGTADRFTACGGDLFHWRGKPGSFDLILLANVVHLFPPAQVRELLDHLRSDSALSRAPRQAGPVVIGAVERPQHADVHLLYFRFQVVEEALCPVPAAAVRAPAPVRVALEDPFPGRLAEHFPRHSRAVRADSILN